MQIYIYTEREMKKKRECVTKAKIISFSGLCNGNNRNVFYTEV